MGGGEVTQIAAMATFSSFSFKEKKKRLYFCHTKVETALTFHHLRLRCSFSTPQAKDPLTFAQSRSALRFLPLVLFLTLHTHIRLAGDFFVHSLLNVPYVVTLLERKYTDPFLSMHVFISQFAVHHDARPSVSAR